MERLSRVLGAVNSIACFGIQAYAPSLAPPRLEIIRGLCFLGLMYHRLWRNPCTSWAY